MVNCAFGVALKMSGIFRRFLGPASLLFGLLVLLCAMPASPARAGGAGDTPGDCLSPGRSCVGEPIILPFRNVYDKVTDFTTVGQNPLAVTRHYNSEPGVPPARSPTGVGPMTGG